MAKKNTHLSTPLSENPRYSGPPSEKKSQPTSTKREDAHPIEKSEHRESADLVHGGDVHATGFSDASKKGHPAHGADAHATGFSSEPSNPLVHGGDTHATGFSDDASRHLLHGGDALLTGGSSPRLHSQAPREVLFGRYELYESLGSGGMAEVWRAYDRTMQQSVALKRIIGHLQENDEAKRRFFREIQLLQELKHPHIISIYDASPEGLFFTMELLQGRDMRQFLMQRKRLPLHVALRVFGQVGQALLAAHQAGVVHRDLKPENIFLLEEPPLFVKLLDFGIAVAIEGTRMTMTQQAHLGTAYYMAPEQLHGETHAIGPAADVYSCGVLLYEILTGRIPQFGAPSISKHLEKLEKQSLLEQSEIPSELRDMFFSHLEDLEKAYQQALPIDPEDRCSLHTLTSSVDASFTAWQKQRKQAATQRIAKIEAALEQGQEQEVFATLVPDLMAVFSEQAEVIRWEKQLSNERTTRDALAKALSVEETAGTAFWEERMASWKEASDTSAFAVLYQHHPLNQTMAQKQRDFEAAKQQNHTLAETNGPIAALAAWAKTAHHFQAAQTWRTLLEAESACQRRCEEATESLLQSLKPPWPLEALQDNLALWDEAVEKSAFSEYFKASRMNEALKEAAQEEEALRKLQREGDLDDFLSALQRAKGLTWPTELAEMRASVESAQQAVSDLEKETRAYLQDNQRSWEESESLKQRWEELAHQERWLSLAVQRNSAYQGLCHVLDNVSRKWKLLEFAVATSDFEAFESALRDVERDASPRIERYRRMLGDYQETYRALEQLLLSDDPDARVVAEQRWKDFLASVEMPSLFEKSPAHGAFSLDKKRKLYQKMLQSLEVCEKSPAEAINAWRAFEQGKKKDLPLEEKELSRAHVLNLLALQKTNPTLSFLGVYLFVLLFLVLGLGLVFVQNDLSWFEFLVALSGIIFFACLSVIWKRRYLWRGLFAEHLRTLRDFYQQLVLSPAMPMRVFENGSLVPFFYMAGARRVFHVGEVDFPMRWIPAGSFWMGSPEGDKEASRDEKPQHQVTITRGFWMMETPVTQGQYLAVTGMNPSHFNKAGLDAPVEMISWHDAVNFANKLSAQGGFFVEEGDREKGSGGAERGGWRLPTEAEWEYACRAGSTEPRYGQLDSVAWYSGNSGGTTHPVGEKQANAWELKDMLGNVREWTMDVHGTYEGLDTRDPVRNSGDTTRRVLRGGSWISGARGVRSADRFNFAPTVRVNYLGFRLLRP